MAVVAAAVPGRAAAVEKAVVVFVVVVVARGIDVVVAVPAGKVVAADSAEEADLGKAAVIGLEPAGCSAGSLVGAPGLAAESPNFVVPALAEQVDDPLDRLAVAGKAVVE